MANSPRIKVGRPAKGPGLFRPACASCGKAGLVTTSGEWSTVNAGFCPSCGVFVGFECARIEGDGRQKSQCPVCGTPLRTNTLLMWAVMIGISIFWISLLFILKEIISIWKGHGLTSPWDIFAVAITFPVLPAGLWALITRYRLHRRHFNQFRTGG